MKDTVDIDMFGEGKVILVIGASQVALVVKNPPANAGARCVRPLGPEDLLEEEMATYSSILA